MRAELDLLPYDTDAVWFVSRLASQLFGEYINQDGRLHPDWAA